MSAQGNHGSIPLQGTGSAARRPAPTGDRQINTSADDRQIRRLTLGNIVGRFKSLTARRYLCGVHADNWQPFPTRLWQRNYYEHIIREDQDYQSIFDYILANPQTGPRNGNTLVTDPHNDHAGCLVIVTILQLEIRKILLKQVFMA
ncbi:MAG TPA: hypothetical protein PLR56_04855 [Brevefilum sp.]|nr:hypothetical protein [Brevefilum sp.]